ncbi:hypothetical protein A8H39_01275 [Paraburkholderia fungorum]|uniref:hypothetical protein n=1 Tax=Paraburkholderia fungorum TaxID=134537 RepID=UPI000C99C824|nr:hypothetical protein [Paraburkholderia fungorum]PNE59807.1 hypothetical protein A8H39_01275 [Paraburkholderia fungorum]
MNGTSTLRSRVASYLLLACVAVGAVALIYHQMTRAYVMQAANVEQAYDGCSAMVSDYATRLLATSDDIKWSVGSVEVLPRVTGCNVSMTFKKGADADNEVWNVAVADDSHGYSYSVTSARLFGTETAN